MTIAVVLGSAKGWEAEYEKARKMLGREFDAVYCVKRNGIVYTGGRFIWVGLHPEFMDVYESERAALGLHKDYEIVAPLIKEVGPHGQKGTIHRRVSYRYNNQTGSSGSGGYGIKVALDDGHEKVVVVGCPMEVSRGHFSRGAWKHENIHGSSANADSNPDAFKPGWEASMPYWKGKVKSMSGWTRTQLGEPTPEWLGVIPANQIGESPGVMPG